MRIMYDSVTAADIPRGARMVAGYVSGRWRWSATDWARFPDAVKVTIATQATVDDGVVLDVEPGDATPEQAPDWVRRRRAAGVDPTVYCNLSALVAVKSAFTATGTPQPHYWVARYDNVPAIPAGCVAKQYSDPATSGGHFDLSAVADYWPGVDPAPLTEDTMTSLDDRFQSEYAGPDGRRSTVTLTYADALRGLDANVYFMRQVLLGEQRIDQPDGGRRNFGDYTVDSTGRLMDVQAKLTALLALVAQQHDVTAEDIATALRAGLVSDLAPVLQQVLADALASDNTATADQIATDVIAKLGERLTSKGTAA